MGRNILWPLLHIFRGSRPPWSTPLIFELALRSCGSQCVKHVQANQNADVRWFLPTCIVQLSPWFSLSLCCCCPCGRCLEYLAAMCGALLRFYIKWLWLDTISSLFSMTGWFSCFSIFWIILQICQMLSIRHLHLFVTTSMVRDVTPR